ncbi:sigma-70 family RNA polymerase sigma factor [Leptospira idonii]|uniref:Sigma-70 family RNA polymerase sigma factor n=1 Tax=Leptospira idonii TaxID=1193500 RepID=A0A4R9LZT1_9LEPT|nr:sigma-70 family RNA polymerase sigma factor [Leptospira idonii]TGN19015.1 sigma-70 family RNA polymerase sigma factor [Leptospira idonii]
MEGLKEFLEHKGLIFGIAYRMTGSISDSEDIVQETFLRWQKSLTGKIKSPKAFLCTIATRLSIDSIRKSKRKKETYIGPWLAEPIPDPQEEVNPESLDLAFLHLMEKLNPVERAVFLLRESFGLDYSLIAKAVSKKEDACRQTLTRAKKTLKSSQKKFVTGQEERRSLMHRFLIASSEGNPEKLIPYLKEEIAIWSDGGGKVHAARIPLFGRLRVAAYLIRTNELQKGRKLEYYMVQANGSESILAYENGRPIGFRSFQWKDSGLVSMYTVVNPDKLSAFTDKQKLIEENKLYPLELFILFPKRPFFKKPIPVWSKPLVSLVRWTLL